MTEVTPTKKQTPSIGRVVHHRKVAGAPERAAVITGLNLDGTVDLTVYTNNPGNPIVVMSKQPEASADDNGTTGWFWPPYVPPAGV